jgi:hypothetical protein
MNQTIYTNNINECSKNTHTNDDDDTLLMNISYEKINKEFKYIPFVISLLNSDKLNKLGLFTFAISPITDTKPKCVIEIKINVYEDANKNIKTDLFNYEVLLENTDTIYISEIKLDTVDNILTVWLLNNTQYIIQNLDPSMILSPIESGSQDDIEYMEFKYSDKNSTKYGSSGVTKGLRENLRKTFDNKFKQKKFNYLNSISTEILFNNIKKDVAENLNIIYKEISELKKTQNDPDLNYKTETITTGRVDRNESDEYSNGEIKESFIPLMFELPDGNAESKLKIIGLKDTLGCPIHIWATLDIVKIDKNIFVDLTFRQDKKYIAFISVENNYLIIWLKRFMMYNFNMLNINVDIDKTINSINKIYPELKSSYFERNEFEQSNFYNTVGINKKISITINLRNMPLMKIKPLPET